MTASPSGTRLALRPWWQQTLLAAAIALTVTAIATVADWCQYRQEVQAFDGQAATRQLLEMLNQEMKQFLQNHGRWPDSLAELGRVGAGQEQPWLDQWHHPLLYEFRNGKPVIVSLGRDGRRGGAGANRDLFSGEAPGPLPPATLGEFLFELPSRGMTFTCILTGVVAFLLTLYLTWQRRPGQVVGQLMVCACFAVLTAIVISALHIPKEILNSH
jgi:hypothetical protein